MFESLQFVFAKICRRLCDSCDTTIYGLENGLYKLTATLRNQIPGSREYQVVCNPQRLSSVFDL